MEKPKYVIVCHQYTVDEQEKWLVEVKKKVWYGYRSIADVGVSLVDAFSSHTKDIVIAEGYNTQDEARKWALNVIQEDSQEVKFIKKIEEGVWL